VAGRYSCATGSEDGPVPAPADAVAVRVHAALLARSETVAAAESLTAGLLCATLATVPGAGATLRGGLVVYAAELKERLAGVPADLLARHGAVSPPTAVALAEGVRLRCGGAWAWGSPVTGPPSGPPRSRPRWRRCWRGSAERREAAVRAGCYAISGRAPVGPASPIGAAYRERTAPERAPPLPRSQDRRRP
jgi:nicotinamide mononucleotide (NMN) deamidase PncC